MTKNKEEEAEVETEEPQSMLAVVGPIALLGVGMMFAGWYMGFAQCRKLDAAVMHSSNIPEDVIYFREPATPSFWGYRLELVRSDQPVYSLGELKQIERNRDLAMGHWKRRNLRARRDIENIEYTQNPDTQKLKVAAVPPHPQRGVLSDDEVQALREIGIGEWEE
tara:strand:+ start:1993 stop:2487 length:495 start_codon:yes stop_codon:yes gene_type:complete